MRLPTVDEIIEWVAAGILSATIGWATKPKWGVVMFAVYVVLVLTSISWQMETFDDE